MPTGNPKSILLGGRYGWRTQVLSSLDDTGGSLSLKKVRDVPAAETETKAPERQELRFEVGRLTYAIDLVTRNVTAYAKQQVRHRWVCRDETGAHVAASDERAWEPVDIVGTDKCVFILDRAHQSVYLHAFGRETISLAFKSDDPDSRWSRLTIDDSGCVLVHDARDEQTALAYNQQGKLLGKRKASWPRPLVFETTAPKANAKEPSDDPSYVNSGSLLTKALDSRLYNCTWHRMEIVIDALPPGTEIEIASFAYKDAEDAPSINDDPRLVTAHKIIAPTQPPPDERRKPRTAEFLIQSVPGEFLSVAIRLRGDGFSTAVVSSLRVHYPRESYLEYLPPLYSANEPTRLFLEKFLSIFQTEWDEFDRRIDESEAFFDPDSVPEGKAMDYLASILGTPLEGSWSGAQNRKLLQAVPKIYPHRGTLAALRDYVRVYLANFAGLTLEEIEATPFPAFVEGYQERQFLALSQSESAQLGAGKPLWSPGVVKRLQLGVFATEGEVELISTGDPERDVFHHFAHRFRVYVPAAWVRTADEESLLRRAIETEMPAHVSYELCLIDAGAIVGTQSIVGLNMIIGDPPPLKLSCEPELDAPSLPQRNRLNSSAVVSSGKGPAVLDADAQVGNWTLN